MEKNNKVKFNLKNVHYAPIESQTDTELIYGHVRALPGAVKLSLEAQGDVEPFYADGRIYYQSAANNGYAGDLEIALMPDEFRQSILMEQEQNGVLVENVNAQYKNLALGFQIDGDQTETLFWFLNCSVSRPTTEASTLEDTKTPQTDTLGIRCAPAPNGNVRVKTKESTSDEIRRTWFNNVFQGEGTAASGASRMKAWPISSEPMDAKLGAKSSADLLGNDISIDWTGTIGMVHGTVKNIKEAWTEFSKTDNTGHFFPFMLDSQYDGEEITLEGAAAPKTTTDLKIIVRLENLTGDKITVKVKNVVILILDFSEAKKEA